MMYHSEIDLTHFLFFQNDEERRAIREELLDISPSFFSVSLIIIKFDRRWLWYTVSPVVFYPPTLNSHWKTHLYPSNKKTWNELLNLAFCRYIIWILSVIGMCEVSSINQHFHYFFFVPLPPSPTINTLHKNNFVTSDIQIDQFFLFFFQNVNKFLLHSVHNNREFMDFNLFFEQMLCMVFLQL